jgi:hypothetical protein
MLVNYATLHHWRRHVLWFSRELSKGLAKIVLLLTSGYGLILMGAFFMNLNTNDRDSKFAREVITKHVQKYSVNYQASLLKSYSKTYLGKTKAEILALDEVKKKLNLATEKEAARLYSEMGVITLDVDDGGGNKTYVTKESPALEKEFDSLRKTAIRRLVWQKDDVSLGWLFLKGIFIDLIALLLLVFMAGKKSDWAELGDFDSLGDMTDRSRDLALAAIVVPMLIFIVYQVILFKNLGCDSDSSAFTIFLLVVWTVVFVFFVRFGVFVPLTGMIYQAIQELRETADKAITLFAYHWLKLKSGDEIFNSRVLKDLSDSGPLFMVSQGGVKRIIIGRKNDNYNLPVYYQRENSDFSPEQFFSLLTQGSKTEAFKDLRGQLILKFVENYGAQNQEKTMGYLEEIKLLTESQVRTALSQKRLVGWGKADSFTEKKINSLVKESFKNFRTELINLSQVKFEAMMEPMRLLLQEYLVEKIKEKQEKESYYSSEILPLQSRFFFRQADISLFVVEQPPQMRNIYYQNERFHLAFPFVIFVAGFRGNNFETLNCFYSNQSLKSAESELFLSNMANINEQGYVCLGSEARDRVNRLNGSFGDKTDLAISSFWQASFNNDLHHRFVSYGIKYKELETYHSWARYSKKNSLFVLNINWDSVGKLLSNIDSIIRNYGNKAFESETYQEKVDEWFGRNNDILRENILRLWSDIDLEVFSKEVIKKLQAERGAEIEKIMEEINEIFKRESVGERIKMEFWSAVGSALDLTMKEDFARLALTIPLKQQVSLDNLVK